MWKDLNHQAKIAEILRKSISLGRTSHAYLFVGPKGAGKRELALQLAKSLFCPNGEDGESCDYCSVCKRIDHGNHPDLYTLPAEGGTIPLDLIRSLQEEMNMKPFEAGYRIYIIPGADRMTREAQNRLLKFLEEPSGRAIGILLTDKPERLLPTVQSRCQIYHLQKRDWKEVAAQVEEYGIDKSDARVGAIIGGSLEEALALCQKESFAELRQKVIQFYYKDWRDRGRALTAFHESFLLPDLLKEDPTLFFDLSLVWHRDLLQLSLDREEEVANLDALKVAKDVVTSVDYIEIDRRMMKFLEGRRAYEATHSTFALEKMILEI